jgi:hypothetical protein
MQSAIENSPNKNGPGEVDSDAFQMSSTRSKALLNDQVMVALQCGYSTTTSQTALQPEPD